MTEVYYPDLSHPSARELEFMVDGKPVTTGTVTNDTLTYTQTSETRAWRLIRTYVTDPERATVLIKVRFESLDGEDHDVEIAYDPQLYNDGTDDVGWTRGHALLAHDRHIASALVARPALTRTSSGYKGHDERPARAHLRRAAARQRRPAGPHAPDRPRQAPRPDARARLRPGRHRRRSRSPSDSLDARLRRDRRRLQAGLGRLPHHAVPDPGRRAAGRRRLRDEPARAQGARGQGQPGRVRRQPEHAVGLGRAAIDRQPALGAVSPRLGARPLPDRHRAAGGGRQGSARTARSTSSSTTSSSTTARSRRTPRSTARPKWTGCRWTRSACRSCSPGSSGARSRTGATSAGRRLHRREGPMTEPGALGEPGRLLAGHDRGRDRRAGLRGRHRARNGDDARATTTSRPLGGNVERWTATTNGRTRTPVLPAPDQGPQPDGPTNTRSATRASKLDQRRVVDVGFLELVRLGVKRPDDPAIVNTLQVVDRRLKARRFWHRFVFDGYGERRDGELLAARSTTTRARTLGRAGRSSPASAASTSCSRAARRTRCCSDGRTRPTAAGCSPSRSGTAARRPARRASSRAKGRSRRRRWPGRTRSSSGSPGRPRRALRSSARRSSPTATRAVTRASALSFLADLAPERGFPLPRRIHEPTTLGARLSWPAETSGSL